MGKTLFLRCEPKCGVTQLDYRIFKSTLSLEQIDKITWFFPCWTNLWKLKVDRKFFAWEWPKMGLDSKIDCISRMSWCNKLVCLHARANSGKLKLLQWFLGGCGLLWIELIFCRLMVRQIFLIRLISYSLSSTFKWFRPTLVVLMLIT